MDLNLCSGPFWRRLVLLGCAICHVSALQFGIAGETLAAERELAEINGANGFSITAEAPDGELGFSVNKLGDFNGDGFDDLILGAPQAQSGGRGTGRAYVIFGSGNAFASSVDLASLSADSGFILNGEADGDQLGWAVSGAGDINGDGLQDLVVGAPEAAANGAASGRSYVVFGTATTPPQPLSLDSLNGSNGFVIDGAAADDRSGGSLSAAGDVNNDGFDDLLIGASGAAANGGFSGRAYIIYGANTEFPAVLELSSLDGNTGLVLNGEAEGDAAGESVSGGGDINGDGVDDVVIGAPAAVERAGRVYVVFGSAAGFPQSLELSSLQGSAGLIIDGEMEFDRLGRSVSAAGDVNGDGIDDVVMGADLADPNGRSSGRAYVLFGSQLGFSSPLDSSSLNGANGLTLNGEADGDAAARSVSGVGDVNDDGLDDLLIGALFADPNGDRSGRGYLIFGRSSPAGNPIELSSLDATSGFAINGAAAEDRAGAAVSGAGDINGDGVDDLLIGASEVDAGDAIFSGRAYVVFGQRDGLFMSGFEGANEDARVVE